jgi:hypothetical protein
METLSIGSKVWMHDPNRRYYTKPDRTKNEQFGKLVYRKSFREFEIIDETKTHWIIGTIFQERKNKFGKMPKVADPNERFPKFLTTQQMEDNILKYNHAVPLSDCVRNADADTLRAVAQLAGYIFTENIIEEKS